MASQHVIVEHGGWSTRASGPVLPCPPFWDRNLPEKISIVIATFLREVSMDPRPSRVG